MKFVKIFVAFGLFLGANVGAHQSKCGHEHRGNKIIWDSPCIGVISTLGAENSAHKMQHGFILAESDSFASHLVAEGPHSWQANITGNLDIPNRVELSDYHKRKKVNESTQKSYFLFQAQNLSLEELQDGIELHGHIVESQVGHYEPKNKIVSHAIFKVQEVLLNLPNPFFLQAEIPTNRAASHSKCSVRQPSGRCSCENGKWFCRNER